MLLTERKFPNASGWWARCSALPDLDVIGFRFGIHYGDFWGHRGFTHSLVFAALLASVVALVMTRRGLTGIGRFALFGYLFLQPLVTAYSMRSPTVGLESHSSRPSTTPVISCLGDLFAFHQLRSLGSSRCEESQSLKMSFLGFGFLPYCSDRWC